jgi:hypothetical protein
LFGERPRAVDHNGLAGRAVPPSARSTTSVPAGIRFQPVDAGEVAARLVELSLGKPSGLEPDIGGPRVYE